eukprot:comp13560_c0_seq1/m.9147 comp13560_c0_seq1/g.9147  ORF comp13560_c0_seq1/g.9147 comp13560_c0_seq1/m.9147 type:complete len:136 (-) comp13560_c0_seq1:208-615(-)
MSAPPASAQANEAITNNKAIGQASTALSPGLMTNLFGCCEDVVGALLSCCLPCVPLATVQAQLDERECTFCDAICIPNPYTQRQTMRAKFGMEYGEVQDCASVTCCTCCFVSQNVREYSARTGKPAIYFTQPKAA